MKQVGLGQIWIMSIWCLTCNKKIYLLPILLHAEYRFKKYLQILNLKKIEKKHKKK